MFQLCRRCHFHKVTDILDCLTRQYEQGELHPRNELLLNSVDFRRELLHPAREQALLNLLTVLLQHNRVQFIHVMGFLKEDTTLQILLLKRIETHRPGRRCSLYRYAMQDPTMIPDTVSFVCWDCLAWAFRSRDERISSKAEQGFPRSLSKLTSEGYLATGPTPFLDFCTTTLIRNKEWFAIALIEYMFHLFPFDLLVSFVQLVFQEPLFRIVFFHSDIHRFVPPPLEDEAVVSQIRKGIYQKIKRDTDLYKEELVIKTWHPDRLFSWCLDMDDLKDFED